MMKKLYQLFLIIKCIGIMTILYSCQNAVNIKLFSTEINKNISICQKILFLITKIISNIFTKIEYTVYVKVIIHFLDLYTQQCIIESKVEIPKQYGSYRHKCRALKCGRIQILPFILLGKDV